MEVTVQIPTAFRRHTEGVEALQCSVANLEELLAALKERFPALAPHLTDASGRPRRFLNIYVNDEDIRFLGCEKYRFRDGDHVELVPSIAGGTDSVEVASVPATSANLGCAFDCAGLTLNCYLRASAIPCKTPGFTVSYRGENPERVPEDETNLVVRGLQRVAVWAGVDSAGASIEIDNDIPVGVGLGSSAAAILAGVLLGVRLWNCRIDPSALLGLAGELEGHPDNVAAAYFGGLVFAAANEDHSQILTWKTSLPAGITLVVAVPDAAVATRKARQILPAQYSRVEVVHNLQRVALLAAICGSGQPGFVPELFRDRLHQHYRASAVPGVSACLELRHPGLLGVYLSGSGPAVVALTRNAEKEIGDMLAMEFHRRKVPVRIFPLAPAHRGADVYMPTSEVPISHRPERQRAGLGTRRLGVKAEG